MRRLVLLALLLAAPSFAARTVIPSTVVRTQGVVWVWTQSDLVNGNACAFSTTGTFLLADNTAGATAVSITIRSSQKDDGDLAAPDRVVSLPAVKMGIMGPLSLYYFQSDGSVWFDSSAAVKFACMVAP